MASLIKRLYCVLIVLNIAADLINLRDDWFKQNGHEISMHSSSLLLPGANGALPAILAAAAARAILSKSAKKAARKFAKNQARVKGNARNKAKKTQGGAGKWHT